MKNLRANVEMARGYKEMESILLELSNHAFIAESEGEVLTSEMATKECKNKA